MPVPLLQTLPLPEWSAQGVGASAAALLPEAPLVLGSLAAFLLALAGHRGRPWAYGTAWAAVGLSMLLRGLFPPAAGLFFSNTLVMDGVGNYLAWVADLGFVLWLALLARPRYGWLRADAVGLLLVALVGVHLMGMGQHLLLLLVALELVSVAQYLLTAFEERDPRAAEAAVKYLLLGLTGTGLTLYGMALWYGHVGTLSLVALPAGAVGPNLLLPVVLLLSGVLFKLSAVPWHLWVPDVYAALPAGLSAFFATLPKVGALGMLIRLRASLPEELGLVLLVLAAASLALGHLAALRQADALRLLGYSSIGQAGYLLLPLASPGGHAGPALVYLPIYLVGTLAAFGAVAVWLRRAPSARWATWSSLPNALATPTALIWALGGLSLAGLPPLLGFFGKWVVLVDAYQSTAGTAAWAGLRWAALVLGILGTVLGLYAYARPLIHLLGQRAANTMEHQALLIALTLPQASVLWLWAAGLGLALALGGWWAYNGLLQLAEQALAR